MISGVHIGHVAQDGVACIACVCVLFIVRVEGPAHAGRHQQGRVEPAGVQAQKHRHHRSIHAQP